MAAVDSSVLIHLMRIGKLSLLKNYFNKIFITKEVHSEILEGNIGVSEFKTACNEWIIVCEIDKRKSSQLGRQEGITQADASILLLAQQNKKILITNDYVLIRSGLSKNITCWWTTTFIINCLKKKKIRKEEAKKILLELINSGMRLNNVVYTHILKEIDDFED